MWGSGFLATKIGLHYAAPFTFLTLRFMFGIVCLTPIVMMSRAPWPASRRDFLHVVVAGLLMHSVHLGGSHYTQYLGVSAGIGIIFGYYPARRAASRPRMPALPLWVWTRSGGCSRRIFSSRRSARKSFSG